MRKFVLILVSLLLLVSCGKAKQVKNILDTAATVAGTDKELTSDSIDWENRELSEQDIRKFYSGVKTLEQKYPEVDFGVALTASMEAMSQGLNLKKIVEKETEMSFSEYNGLSTAILLVETNSASLFLVENMVSSLEESLTEYEAVDTSQLSEEEKVESELAIEELKSKLESAREEMESPEFRKRLEESRLVLSTREEMGL